MIVTLAAVVSSAGVIGGGLWWLYLRGQASGREKAELKEKLRTAEDRITKLESELSDRGRRRRL